ncbi:hypothetical protein V2J09_020715, partial [Rumex salicifolius]
IEKEFGFHNSVDKTSEQQLSDLNGASSCITNKICWTVELDKQTYCDLKVLNNTEDHVAFKVKTTSPNKYFVRPNIGVIHPSDSCIIRVTLQAQREYPHDMISKDKFLLQSTVVPSDNNYDVVPQSIFNKDSGRVIEECKLRVVYLSPNSAQGDDDYGKSSKQSPDEASSNPTIRRLKKERDAVVRQTRDLQDEIRILRLAKVVKGDPGFSFKFAALVTFIGIMLGFLLKLTFSSPSTE